MGFGVPLADWFRGPLRERMESYCSGPELIDMGIDPVPVRAMWHEFQQGRSHRVYPLWSMFTLMAWTRRFRSTPVTV
jgi:asparagine synthase (glutamine-hydrolysing)